MYVPLSCYLEYLAGPLEVWNSKGWTSSNPRPLERRFCLYCKQNLDPPPLPPSSSNGPALLCILTSDFLDEGRDNHFVMSRKNACHLHTKQKSNCRAIETLDSQIQTRHHDLFFFKEELIVICFQ